MTATIDLLGTQHQEVLVRLSRAEAEIRARNDSDLAVFAAYLANEVAHHFVIEEHALFPLLADHLGQESGPLAVMNAEHAAFRELLAELTAAVEAGAVDAQRTHAVELIELLRGHITKEDQVLFPMAARLLSVAELDEVDRRAAALAGSPLSSRM